ncbi:DUF3060 domain-containing protein [Tsukamurella strandjordii]|uniref:DUF3060 domain-containing protein n=1 Tax=Tsukamurella strandjordii TaxID=147577 RepID=A0AA90S9N8_9ACTN|nr:DUF3060 domain-containing protein [Tsukamurella strandjordii]MDP0400370.1 DUF3060 domain-containing protein [Tsukamurella strandjordii]
MKNRILTIAAATALGAALAPAGIAAAGPGDVFGSGITQTVHCMSDGVSVSGSRNTLTVVAHCDLLMVSGDSNVITTSYPIKNIVVTGRDNIIKCDGYYGTKVSDRGFGNVVKC